MVNMKAFSDPEKLLRLSRNGPQVTVLVSATRKFVGLTPYHAFNIDYANLQLQKYDSLWCILSVQSSCQMEGRHRANSPIYTWTSCNHPYGSLSLAPLETSSVWLVIDNFVSSSEEGKDLSNHVPGNISPVQEKYSGKRKAKEARGEIYEGWNFAFCLFPNFGIWFLASESEGIEFSVLGSFSSFLPGIDQNMAWLVSKRLRAWWCCSSGGGGFGSSKPKTFPRWW